jgi:hypothetical protein
MSATVCALLRPRDFVNIPFWDITRMSLKDGYNAVAPPETRRICPFPPVPTFPQAPENGENRREADASGSRQGIGAAAVLRGKM